MQSVPFPIRAAILTFALLTAPATAMSQTQAPTREGNTWDWRDHQPTEARNLQNEEAAGVAPTPAQRNSNAATVDQLYQQLLHHSPGQ